MPEEIKDYPVGDGRPNCPLCLGRGVVEAPPKPGRIIVGGRTVPCGCILERDILCNVERGWHGLAQAAPIPSSPLKGLENKNLRITAGHKAIREHLRHVAIRQGPKWAFNVVSDADLMNSWLTRIDDVDIIDGDVEQLRRQPITSKYGSLVDMVEPPDLLILIMGVKAARNSAMPEVVLEALQHRAHKNKVTWIVDQPEYRLAGGHISYSALIVALIGKWRYIDLDAPPKIGPCVHQVQRRAPRTGPQMMDMGRSEVEHPTPAPVQEPTEHAVSDGDDGDPDWMKDAVDKLVNGGKKKFGRRK